MNLKILISSVCLFLGASGVHSRTPEEFSKSFSYFSISPKNLSLKKGERITGFILKLKEAYIYSAPIIPQDWAFDISNWGFKYRPWTCYVEAGAHHGAGWVEPTFFKDFLIIGKSLQSLEKFQIYLEVSTIDGKDKEQSIVFDEKDLLLVPTKVKRAF